MNKYANSILKYLNKHSSEQQPIDMQSLFEKFNMDEETFSSSIHFLENNKMIKCLASYENTQNGYLTVLNYCSTTVGKEYFKIQNLNKLFIFLKTAFWSIICPLLVAYLTAWITTNSAISDNQCCDESNQARQN